MHCELPKIESAFRRSVSQQVEKLPHFTNAGKRKRAVKTRRFALHSKRINNRKAPANAAGEGTMNHICRTKTLFIGVSLLVALPFAALSFPSVYPTGTTIFHPDQTWSGYTLFNTPQGAILIDMNGNELRRWEEIWGHPPRILPGGQIMGGVGERTPYQEVIALTQQDWDGNIIWQYDGAEQVQTEDGQTVWASRQHHDWQREGSPAGYYAESEPLLTEGRTLVLGHKELVNLEISDKRLEDDYIYELSWDGEILWDWSANEHIDEFGFSEDARNAIYRSVSFTEAQQSADWLHINGMSYVGPNHWYDEGDERFHPDNVIFSSRQANIVVIIDRTGSVVWRIGPDYRETAAMRALGQVSGQHHPHIIPIGLPGAGNIMFFDNGGAAGYGAGTPFGPDGRNIVARDYSRVLEINPVTLEKVWEYSIPGGTVFQFYSPNVSSAQRLANGNTLITEGAAGRIFEATADKEIVWEFVNPYFNANNGRNNMYRAYRVPYDWVPQLQRPQERAVIPPNLAEFRIQPQ